MLRDGKASKPLASCLCTVRGYRDGENDTPCGGKIRRPIAGGKSYLRDDEAVH